MTTRFCIAAQLLLIAVCGAIFVTPASATTYSFGCFTTNTGQCGTLNSDLTVDITTSATDIDSNPATNEVSFKFQMSTDAPWDGAAITEIYFDDGSILALAQINNGTGTNFGKKVNPPDLPGGNLLDPDFIATTAFGVDASGPTSDGVNPGEMVELIYTLQAGQTIDDVIAQLQNGTLRIGIHVRGIPCTSTGTGDPCQLGAENSSDSFVLVAVPEPVSLILFGTGLVGLAGYRRRKNRPERSAQRY